jgi:hypothetical protein
LQRPASVRVLALFDPPVEIRNGPLIQRDGDFLNHLSRMTKHPTPNADVFLRVFDLSRGGMTQALAESILALDFPEGDAARIEELNVRANEGDLTDEEEAELEAYTNINDLLAYWQSKARQALHQPA